MDEKAKKLKKMATWTIAVFATIFAVTTAVLYMVMNPITGGTSWNVLGAVMRSGWLIYVLDVVLCIAAYFGYKVYLDRKK
jgi:hypothetical protein